MRPLVDDDPICRVQDALLSMGIGGTKVVWGRVVTRHAKDAFEVDTWGVRAGVCSETAAELIIGGAS